MGGAVEEGVVSGILSRDHKNGCTKLAITRGF